MYSTAYNLWTFTWFVYFELPFRLKGTEKIHTKRLSKFPSNIYSILFDYCSLFTKTTYFFLQFMISLPTQIKHIFDDFLTCQALWNFKLLNNILFLGFRVYKKRKKMALWLLYIRQLADDDKMRDVPRTEAWRIQSGNNDKTILNVVFGLCHLKLCGLPLMTVTPNNKHGVSIMCDWKSGSGNVMCVCLHQKSVCKDYRTEVVYCRYIQCTRISVFVQSRREYICLLLIVYLKVSLICIYIYLFYLYI